MTEEVLLTAPLEPTNEWYAIARIAGIKLCQAYRRQYGADFAGATVRLAESLYTNRVVPELCSRCEGSCRSVIC